MTSLPARWSLWLRREVSALVCALQFLTRIPVPDGHFSESAFRKSVTYFPLVGVIVGAAGCIAYLLAQLLWPDTIAIVVALLVMILCTGGFHEDGLADTADGIGGGWRAADKLRIMKDSRIGTYGALALVLALLLKFTALSNLPAADVTGALLVAHAVSRWCILPLVRYTDYVSGGSGSGTALVGAVSDGRLVAGTLIAIAATVSMAFNHAVAIAVSAVVITASSRWYWQRKLGGITGDTLGATNQLVELGVYFAFAASV